MIDFLYIGNYADTDTDETNYTSENAKSLLNIKVDKDSGLQLVTIELHDSPGAIAGAIEDNDSGYDGDDYVSYVSPTTGNVVNAVSDSSMRWVAKVKVSGEDIPREIQVTVVQMTNGDTFITDYGNNGSLDNLEIESIELIKFKSSKYYGFDSNQSVDNTRVVCFAQTVPIRTPHGNEMVGDLRVGDWVETLDNGSQIIRWIEKKHIDEVEFARNPKLRPVRIQKGALGRDLPTTDILVSRQHRMLVQSEIAKQLFGDYEVLIPAIKLIDLPGIEIAQDVTEIVYVHIMCDKHEILFAADAPSESMLTGKEALKFVSAKARREILELFPHLLDEDSVLATARPMLPGKMQKRLISDHFNGEVPLLSQ